MKQNKSLKNNVGAIDKINDIRLSLNSEMGSKISYTEFCRHLRLSINFNEFRKTKLYSEIFDWQKKHGYTVFKNVA
jgi:hypothetical protein